MTKEKARAAIVNILKKNNWYAVLHDGHSGRYFYVHEIPKNNRLNLQNEIYSAIYEEYDNKYADTPKLMRFNFSYEKSSYKKDSFSWNKCLRLMKLLLSQH